MNTEFHGERGESEHLRASERVDGCNREVRQWRTPAAGRAGEPRPMSMQPDVVLDRQVRAADPVLEERPRLACRLGRRTRASPKSCTEYQGAVDAPRVLRAWRL